MLDEKSREVGRLLFVLDMALTIFVFVMSYWTRAAFFEDGPDSLLAHMALLPIILAGFSVSMSYFGVYRGLKTASMLAYAWAVFWSLGVGVTLLTMFMFLLKIQYVSRAVIILFMGADLLVLAGTRALIGWWYFKRAVEKKENYLKALIIGTGNRARQLAELLPKHSEWGVDIVGFLDPDPGRAGSAMPGGTVMDSVDNISAVLKNHVIDEVYLAVPRSLIKDVDKIVDACEEEGVKLRLMADIFDFNVARMRLVEMAGIPLLTLEPVAQDEGKLMVKRLMDIVICLLILPLVLPVMAVIAIVIKLDSNGPVMFVQKRVGRNKRVFNMHKFRTMIDGSDEKIKELEHMNEAEGPNFKIANDPRVTRAGKFLRKTSLDELPQIINVLRGHMSLVGPRPMSLRDVGLFDKGVQRKRFSVRPGITCLWQVMGRSNLPFSKWLELDLDYIENWSLGMDIKILLKTIPVVLRGTGAV